MDIPLWQILLEIAIFLLLVCLDAVFSGAGIALAAVRGAKLENMIEDGGKSVKMLEKIHKNPEKSQRALQLTTVFIGFADAVISAHHFGKYIIYAANIKNENIQILVELGLMIVLSVIVMIFATVVPKFIALKDPDKHLRSHAWLVRLMSILLTPVLWLINVVSLGILKMFRVDPKEVKVKASSEEDIRILADTGSENGLIDEDENEIIQNVFEFDDTTAGEIATHRTELTVLWEEDDDDEWAKTIKNDVHAFYPICGENIDKITGILDSSKYLRLDDKSRQNVLKNAVLKPHFVAQVMKADVLFKEMKSENSKIAIVVDEYGGTYGVITLHDLVEEIVGDLNFEDPDYVKLGNGYKIKGLADREILEELFEIDEESDSATVGGWVMEKLEKIPEPGDELEADGIHIKVTKSDDRRVLEVYAEKLPDEAEEDE